MNNELGVTQAPASKLHRFWEEMEKRGVTIDGFEANTATEPQLDGLAHLFKTGPATNLYEVHRQWANASLLLLSG